MLVHSGLSVAEPFSIPEHTEIDVRGGSGEASGTESLDQVRERNPELSKQVASVIDNYLEVEGYFRAGYGNDNNGGPQVAFQAPGAMAKYRLGNEAENFGELILGKHLNILGAAGYGAGQDDDGAQADLHLRVDFYNAYDEYASAVDTQVGLPEAWVSLTNVVPSAPGASVWAGKRFYRRHDIGLNDFFFWNLSGGGVGIENIQIGSAKLAVAWLGSASTSGFSNLPQPDPLNKAGFSKTNLDIRLYDAPVLGGSAELGLIGAWTKSGLNAEGQRVDDTSGWSVNLVHTIDEFISYDGKNTFSLQYGREAGKTFTAGFETFEFQGGVYIQPDLAGSWRLRITENFTAQLSDHVSIGPVLVYQETDYGEGAGTLSWFSAGVRPIYHFSSSLSLAVEVGWDNVERSFGEDGSLFKFTVAPQLSLGGRFNSRPVIRAFATWAQWDDALKGEIGGANYMDESHGLTLGAQMEVWW